MKQRVQGETRIVGAHACIVCDHALRWWESAFGESVNLDANVTWVSQLASQNVTVERFRTTVVLHWMGFSTTEFLAQHLGQPFSEDKRIFILQFWREARRRRLEQQAQKPPSERNPDARFAYYMTRAELEGCEMTPELLRDVGLETYGEHLPDWLEAIVGLMRKPDRGAGRMVLRGLGVSKPDPVQESIRARSLAHDARRERGER